MKKVLLVLAIALVLILTTGYSGGSIRPAHDTTIHLPINQKLVDIDWREDCTVWYLTRPMREGEVAETYEYHGVYEGTVTIIEEDSIIEEGE